MPTITRLVAGKKNPSRVKVYIDGRFAFALSIDEVVKSHLKLNQDITDTEIEILKVSDNENKVYGKILNFLSFRPRSVKEVRNRLHLYDVKDVIKQNLLIEKLKSRGYLDDLAFAKWFIESRNTHKLHSPRFIRYELSAKGIGKNVLDQVMSQVLSPEVTIIRLLTKKLGNNRPLFGEERQKVTTYLARQGFAWDKIAEVVKTWESE